MKTNANTHKSTTTQSSHKAKCIKLGIDVHADSYRVVRQLDHATPQPAQKFTPKDFLSWAKKQLTQAEAVHSCYEAGPLGYGLHRALMAMGVHNVVYSCGGMIHQGMLVLPYAASDLATSIAVIDLEELLGALVPPPSGGAGVREH